MAFPSIPSISEIPSVIKSGFDSGLQSGYDYLMSGAAFGDSDETPDFARFMRVIETHDLARPNLFLVRFGDFRTVVSNDGVVDFDLGISTDGGVDNTSGPFAGAAYSWNRVKDIAFDAATKIASPRLKQIMGAYDPTLVSMIPGAGSIMETFLGTGYNVNKDLALMVKSVNLPGTQLETQINKTDRLPFFEVRGRTINNITVTFYCTPGYRERVLMLAWMNSIHNNKTGQYGFQAKYAREIDVLTLDRKGVRQSITLCKGCFPIRVGDVQLDYENNSQVATCEVEFVVSDMNQITSAGTENLFDAAQSLLNRGKGVYGALKK